MTAQMKFDVRAELLRVHAMSRLCEAIVNFGDAITDARRRALDQMLVGMGNQAFGIDPGRYAYALPCGAGKTQGVVALIAAAHELNYGLTFAVAANTIRALVLIKRDLMRAGVPEGAIGLRHGKGVTELAEELIGEDAPPRAMVDTGNDDRQIMLVSHAHIQGTKGTLFATHRGQPRSLLIWDETLLTADAGFVSLAELKDAADNLDKHLSSDSALRIFLKVAVDRIVADFEAQVGGAGPAVIDLSSGVDVRAARVEIKALQGSANEMRRSAANCAGRLAGIADRPVAVSKAGGIDDAIIHYTVAVDPSWSNVAILDASHSIRLLAQAGGVTDRTTDDMRNCRQYGNVRLIQYLVAAGKSTQAKGSRVPARLAANIIQGIPTDEGVLLIAFKDKAAMSLLRRVLADEGIDLNAKLPNGMPRISILTWGRETSTNAYRHCTHVVLVGAFRPNRAALVAMLAGEANDLLHRRDCKRFAEVLLAELAHGVLQGVHRGACRVTGPDGQAGAMTAHIIDSEDGLHEVLAESMPGAHWERNSPENAETRTGRAQQAVIDFLAKLPAATTEISSDELKRGAIAASGLTLGTAGWTKAIKDGLATLDLVGGLAYPEAGRWRRERRRLVRL